MDYSPTPTLNELLTAYLWLRRDIYTVDEQLVETGGMYLRTIFSVISTVAVISGVTPVFVVFMIPMILYYMHEQAFFTVRRLLSSEFGTNDIRLILTNLTLLFLGPDFVS